MVLNVGQFVTCPESVVHFSYKPLYGRANYNKKMDVPTCPQNW